MLVQKIPWFKIVVSSCIIIITTILAYWIGTVIGKKSVDGSSPSPSGPSPSGPSPSGPSPSGPSPSGPSPSGPSPSGPSPSGPSPSGPSPAPWVITPDQKTACELVPQDGFKCEIPNPLTLRCGPDNTKSAAVCEKYAQAADDAKAGKQVSSNDNISFHDIALAWKASGMNMNYCPAALVIAGGECQNVHGLAGCSISKTGKSGLWQVDSARADENINLFNPCDNAKAVYGQIVRSDKKTCDQGCYVYNEDKMTSAPRRLKEGGPSAGGVGGADKSFWDTGKVQENDALVGNCNWLGPFCHWQGFPNRKWSSEVDKTGAAVCVGQEEGSVSCCAWTGGGNSYQPQGFPYYYQWKFLDNLAAGAGKVDGQSIPTSKQKWTPAETAQVEQMSWKAAKSICDGAT